MFVYCDLHACIYPTVYRLCLVVLCVGISFGASSVTSLEEKR